MWGPLGPALDLGEPAPRLLGRDLDVEDAFDRGAWHRRPPGRRGRRRGRSGPAAPAGRRRTGIPIQAPSHELRRVAKPEPLHVVVPYLHHPLGPQGHERHVLTRVPAVAGAPLVLGLGLVGRPPPRMVVEVGDERLELLEQLAAPGHGERADHADRHQQRALVVACGAGLPLATRPGSPRCPGRRTARAAATRSRPGWSCGSSPATTQSAVRTCLIFAITRLLGWYVRSSGLAMRPSSPAPSNTSNHRPASSSSR